MDDYSRNIDQQLLNAYRSTTYQVVQPRITIKIGQKNEHLDIFLIDNNATSWAFVSAENPQSVPTSPEENDKAMLALKVKLNELRYRSCPALGIPAQTDWPTEKSYLILDITKREALALAKDFRQKAILFGYVLGLPDLVFCD
ncbi:MAG: DUF3293 domain-containing protein [Saprospiraceae bacterium]